MTDERRSYFKQTTLEEALRSLLGLKMATSGCPVLSELKPMALHHLPFANSDEFVMRSVGYYLLQQLFAKRNQQEADWELKGLVERLRQPQHVVRIPLLLSVARTQIQTDLNLLQMGALLTAVMTTDLNTERLRATPFSLGGVSYLETIWPN